MFVRLISVLVPYLTVVPGLLVFHNAWAAILTYHVAMAAIVIFTRSLTPFGRPGKNVNKKFLGLSVIIGACGGAALYLLWPQLSVPADINSYLRSIGLTNETWIYFIVYYVVVNPVFEEYYWRGYLGNGTKRPVLNDFLFAGYHLFVLAGNVGVIWLGVVFLALSGAAWYWRQISRVTGSLLPATLSHMAGDLTVIIAIYYLTQNII